MLKKKISFCVFLTVNNFNTILNWILKFYVKLNNNYIYNILKVQTYSFSSFRDRKNQCLGNFER